MLSLLLLSGGVFAQNANGRLPPDKEWASGNSDPTKDEWRVRRTSGQSP